MPSKGVVLVPPIALSAARRPRILAAFDFSGQSTIALGRAVAVADTHGADLHVVWVHEPGVSGSSMDTGIPADAQTRLREAALGSLGAAQQLGSMTLHILVGLPAAEIAWLAAHLDIDLIVVGTNARNGASHFILGSVSEKVVRIAGCPVLVERSTRHDESWRVPDMDPLCPKCRAHREQSGGLDLWCSDHVSRHLQARVHLAADDARGGPLPPGQPVWWAPSH